jgi:hypothetical protein
VTGVLPAGGRLTLDPTVPHPPFAWSIGLPADWALLDTNPASWQRSAIRLLDDRFAGRTLKAAERRAVHGFLEQLVADCQRAGAAFSVLQLGRLSTGAVGSAGLHLGWYDSAPVPAGLAAVRDGLPRTGVVEEVTTSAGTALLHVDVAVSVPPGTTTRVRSAVRQFFLPLPGTTWTAVLSAATGHPELHRVLAEVVLAVGRSIHPGAAAGTDDGESAVAYQAAPRAAGPGIERGFGTLLLRRVEGADR